MEKLPLAKLFHRVQRMSKFTKTSIEVTRGAQENVLTPLFFPAPISYRKNTKTITKASRTCQSSYAQYS